MTLSEAISKLPKEIMVNDASVGISQEGDSVDDVVQEMVIATQDGGGGHFLIFSTNRWAVNKVEELNPVLEVARALLAAVDVEGDGG